MRQPKSNEVILEKLAFQGPLTIYALNKITGHSTSTIHASIHGLMRRNHAKKDKKGYSLTVVGLVRLLQNRAMWERIGEIVISSKGLLPEYFDLWDTFERMNVKEIAVKLLKYAVGKLSSGVPAFPEQIDGRKPTFEDWLPRLAIFPYDALLDGVLNQEEVESWQQMLLRVPEAEKLYLDTLKWMIESHKSAMESFSRALETYNKLKYWSEKVTQALEIIEKIQDPTERLRALQQNRDLWQAILQLYPGIKDEKGLSALLAKLKTGKRQPL